ncbi:MAG: carboxylesterase/lipase family protein [Terriglobales bacterium]
MRSCRRIALTILLALLFAVTALAQRVRTRSGLLDGKTSPDGQVQIFLGIPYAAPPVDDLRWKEPQPVMPWKGVREAKNFGARCMQARIYSDMVFRDSGPSEDCLHLNVWTPTTKSNAKLPVMVWIFGGGFHAGATSEPRQDGEHLAHRGVVVVSMDYRLGIFGFFSHPELTRESPHHASGNYGLLDQAAALRWVHDNIAAFGGDPDNVTIFGESAGSFSVSGQMASPLSKKLIARAIGESGAFLANVPRLQALADSEQQGEKFGESIGATSLAKLRSLPAKDLLDAATKTSPFRFWPNIDGYFFPASPHTIYAAGDQAHVPLLAGWNRDEANANRFFGKDAPTKENYIAKVNQQFGAHAPEILKAFPADTDAQAAESAGQLASDGFIAFGTWKWIELQQQAGDAPVYRYEFDQPPPAAANPKYPDAGKVAYHSAEIEYVFETLASKDLPFGDEDRKVSAMMAAYWTNFAKSGNPNAKGLPEWPTFGRDHLVMHLAPTPHVEPDTHREQFLVLDQVSPPAH